MCGICGVFNYKRADPVSIKTIEKMNKAISHRGPDDKGYYLDKEIGLGHQRLSVIDLETGQQPIFNEDKSIWCVVNGEIYNYKLLVEELSKKGHVFYTKSDSEVIVHLYEDMGERFVEKLRGMFAIVLWDCNKRRVILVRDRLGIKPLFYFYDSEKLLFGSEIKAILQYPGLSREIDYSALHDYLSFMTTTHDTTIFKGINRLLPAEMLICSRNKIEKRIYWDVPSKDSFTIKSFDDLRDYFLRVVKMHLISDVPVGAFLSGGMDSSSVVALMSEVTNKPIKTFSVGFEGRKYYDELPYARKVARYFNTDHHEFVVKPNSNNLVEIISEMIGCFDEPFAVSSALPTYFLAKLAREKVKVVLTGDGADELMAGYHNRYLGIILSSYFDKYPYLSKIFTPSLFCNVSKNKSAKVNKFFSRLSVDGRIRYFKYQSKFQEYEKKQLYSKDLINIVSSLDSSRVFARYYEKGNGKDPLSKCLYVDLKMSLPDEMLTKVDRMTMAFGLEARIPFLDHLFVEHISSLPSNLKFRKFTSKYILKKIMQDVLPREIIKRPKHGFEVPVDDWIRHELKKYVHDFLNEKRIQKQGIFDWNSVREMLSMHQACKVNLGHQLWMILMFSVWHDKYMAAGAN